MKFGGRDLYSEFGKFGHCDITTFYHTALISIPLEIEIRLLLDVSKMLAFDSSAMHVRLAMANLAEAAIAYAEKHYRLADAPRIAIEGQLHRNGFLGQPEQDPTILTTGMLTLRIIERD